MILKRLKSQFLAGAGMAGFTVADQALVSLVNFSSFFLLARALTDAEFGLFAIGVTTILVLTSFQQALLGNVFQVKAAAREGESLRTFSTIVFAAQAGLSLLVTLALLMAAGVSGLMGAGSTALFLASLGVASGPWLTQDLMRKAFYTKGRIAAALVNDLICYGLQMAGVVWLMVAAAEPSAWKGLMIYGLASALAAGVGMVQLRGLVSIKVLSSPRQVRVVAGEVWSYGKWLATAKLGRELGSTGQTWIIAVLMGPGPLGAFRAATHLVNIFNPLELAVGLWLPSAASRKFDAGGGAGLKKWYDSLVPWLLIPMAVGAVLLMLGAESLIHLAYGGKYDGMGLHWIVAILGFSRVISFGRDLYHNGLVAGNRPDTSVPDSLIAAGLKYGVGIPTVHFWGLLGAPVSSIVVSVGTLLYNRWAFLALPDRDVRPPHRSAWIPVGTGAEGYVFHDVTPGVVTKVYSESASPDLAWRYWAALEAAADRSDHHVVTTPRPLGFEPEIPLIRMESCPGMALGDYIQSMPSERAAAHRIAERIWRGMHSVTEATGTPTYDLWPSNTLFDPESGQLTFIDFAKGEERVYVTDGSMAAQTLGGFLGHALYNLSRPGRFMRPLANLRVIRLCRDLWRLVSLPEDLIAARQVAGDIYLNCTRSGGKYRRLYYQSLGRFLHSLHGRLIFGFAPPMPAIRTKPTMIYHYFSDFPQDHVRSANGVRKAVRNLAAGLEEIGVRSQILTEGAVRSSWLTAGTVDVHCFRSRGRFRGLLLPVGMREYVHALPEDTLFVVHGQFSPRASRVAIMLRRMGRPYVLMPHSLYSQDVFDNHPLKKWAYWHLVEKGVLSSAALVQLMEDSQADPLRERGIRTPVAVIPNAFDPKNRLDPQQLTWSGTGPIRLYYLGRINFHQKGLDLLVKAAAEVRHEYPISLTIQGPDGGVLTELKDIARQTGADQVTTFLPPDYDNAATELMAGYDAYCMPSRIEGFPIAAVEAMQAARPLLFSDVSGLTHAIRESGCGVLVRPTLEDVTRGLRELCSRRAEFRQMGLAGLDYVERHYSRRAVAEQAYAAYSQIFSRETSSREPSQHKPEDRTPAERGPSVPDRTNRTSRLRKNGSEPISQR